MDSSKFPLLIVDDESGIRRQMKWALQDQYEVSEAGNRSEALEAVGNTNTPVGCLDLGLPPDPAGVEKGFLGLDQII